MGRVQDKVAIVTGGASRMGMGCASALLLAREGAKVVVTDIDGAGAEAVAQDIRSSGGTALAFRHDVTSEADWDAVFEGARGEFGRVDVLVNNAGVLIAGPVGDLTGDDWRRQMDVNLNSVFYGVRRAVTEMRKSGGGSIVNMSSIGGLVGKPGLVAYSASKGGVRLLTKATAVEVARENIRVNSIHPGIIWTNMTKAGMEAASESPDQDFGIPMGRLGTAEDVANAVLFLASDESSYITGAEIVVDGGVTAQ